MAVSGKQLAVKFFSKVPEKITFDNFKNLRTSKRTIRDTIYHRIGHKNKIIFNVLTRLYQFIRCWNLVKTEKSKFIGSKDWHNEEIQYF